MLFAYGINRFSHDEAHFITGKVDITEDNCEDLLTAADMLSVTGVVNACCSFLREKFQPENCVGKNSNTSEKQIRWVFDDNLGMIFHNKIYVVGIH